MVGSLNLTIEKQSPESVMVSGELIGALALGYDGEIGNFILR